MKKKNGKCASASGDCSGYTTFRSLVVILSGSVARLRVLTVNKLSNSDAAAQGYFNYQIKVNANQNNVNTIQANVNTIRDDVDDLNSSQNDLLVAFKKECNTSRADGSVRQYDRFLEQCLLQKACLCLDVLQTFCHYFQLVLMITSIFTGWTLMVLMLRDSKDCWSTLALCLSFTSKST
ncbi:hypothetical protein MIR68_008083 [Amoeboaphelidium protococcarum]|nr:hypothetical protein MIR68_008083 [Amoeboaphelidium protococcarum]